MKTTRFLLALSMLAAGAAGAEPLKIWISSYQDKVYYEEMAGLYQKEVDADFTAEVSAFGFREMPDKLAVAIKTGSNAPDVVQLDEVLFGLYLDGKMPFLDLTERIEKAGIGKDMVPSRLQLFSKGDRIYGLAQSLSAMMLYYRVDLFEQFGITPESISTWDAFVAKGRELARNNQPMTALDPTYFDVLLRQRGSDWFGEDGTLFPDEPAARRTLNWLKELRDEGIAIVPERASVFDPVFFSSSVLSDEVICLIGADWFGLDMLQQFTPQLSGKWGIMPLPAWKDEAGVPGRRTSTFAGQGLMIYGESKMTEEAWDFVKFVITHPKANVQRFTGGNSFPAYKPAWKEPKLTAPSEFFNNQSMGRLLIDLAPQVPEVAMHPQRPQAIFLFQENYFSSFLYGQYTAGELIEEMRKALGR